MYMNIIMRIYIYTCIHYIYVCIYAYSSQNIHIHNCIFLYFYRPISIYSLIMKSDIDILTYCTILYFIMYLNYYSKKPSKHHK